MKKRLSSENEQCNHYRHINERKINARRNRRKECICFSSKKSFSKKVKDIGNMLLDFIKMNF